MGLARRIAIVGVGETRYERRAARDLASLRCEASRAALADAGLAAAAVACRRHAALHDNAILATEPLELDGYLASPYLAEPFRSADCCLVNDGAGAFVMTSLERARELRADPVVVLGVGCGVVPDGEYSSLREDYLATAAVHSAPRAFAMAGIEPADIDFVALYDNFTALVIQQLE